MASARYGGFLRAIHIIHFSAPFGDEATYQYLVNTMIPIPRSIKGEK